MRAPEEIALFYAALRKWTNDEDTPTRAMFASAYANGDRRTFRADDGLKLGEVRRDDPDPYWAITDTEALHAHLREFPGCVETLAEIVGTQKQVLAVLREHAPELLAEVTRVRPEAVQAALDESRATGTPAAPGIERVVPTGALKAVADKAAVARVGALIRSTTLPALLPSGETT